MLFITVKYLAPTNHKQSRVKAYVKGAPELGSIILKRNYIDSAEATAQQAAQLLENKLANATMRGNDKMVGWSYTSDEWLFAGLNALKQEIGE